MMNLNEIKSIDDAQRYVNGVINDYEGSISTKEETLSFLGEYTARIMEIFTENVKANPSLLGLTPTSPKEEQTPIRSKEEILEQAGIYAESQMPQDWDRNDMINMGEFYNHLVKNIFSQLPQFKDGKEAVEFAEWIMEKDYWSEHDSKLWAGDDIINSQLTTQQLYQLFLNTKNK